MSYSQSPLPQADPCTLVIFGALGDLNKRKLTPALFNLASEGCLSRGLEILGVDLEDQTDESFREALHQALVNDIGEGNASTEQWESFASHMHYASGNLKDEATFRRIGKTLQQLGGRAGAPNVLFYLAVPPMLAPTLVQQLGETGLSSQGRGWARVIVEKPFGRDLDSAARLNEQIGSHFEENQIYRIDHYLGKDTVQNILVFRFGNSMFEPIWNRNYVDFVEITAAETLGVGKRAGYYEEAGALRDMVANHMLQLLTLTAMEPPISFEADAVREEKVQVLRSIHPMSPDEVGRRTVRAQYSRGTIDGNPVPAYREEPGVASDSPIETYAAVHFQIANWRWSGTPFYLRTGKRLARPLTEIAVHLKRTPQALFARTPDDLIEPNVIVLKLQPQEGITVSFGAKKPGIEMHTGTVHMDFSYQEEFGVRSPAAYETLLLDAMRGDATLFTRRDEVEAQWRLITPIEEAWKQAGNCPLALYEAGSDGPHEARPLTAKRGHKWRPIG